MTKRLGRPSHPTVVCLVAVAILCAVTGESWASDGPIRQLSSGEKAGILGASFGLGVITQILPSRGTDSTMSRVQHVNSIDRWWRTQLHGESGWKSNFLDNSKGTLLTPAAGALAIACMDVNREEFSRDFPFFIAGAVTTGAVTIITKRLVYRPRPYFEPGGIAPPDRKPVDAFHTESFFSGHSSQAFFTAGFVNNRLRRHMRQEWKTSEYRSWRWASPLATFGWATFVGLSRIQADKHYFTDVVTGALVGYGVSEIYYRLCYSSAETAESGVSSGQTLFALNFAF